MSQQFSEQEQIRRESLLALRNMGIEPYPAASFEISHSAATILKQFPEQPDSFKHVSLAGRVMGKRIMGKASFAVIQDSTSSPVIPRRSSMGSSGPTCPTAAASPSKASPAGTL